MSSDWSKLLQERLCLQHSGDGLPSRSASRKSAFIALRAPAVHGEPQGGTCWSRMRTLTSLSCGGSVCSDWTCSSAVRILITGSTLSSSVQSGEETCGCILRRKRGRMRRNRETQWRLTGGGARQAMVAAFKRPNGDVLKTDKGLSQKP